MWRDTSPPIKAALSIPTLHQSVLYPMISFYHWLLTREVEQNASGFGKCGYCGIPAVARDGFIYRWMAVSQLVRSIRVGRFGFFCNSVWKTWTKFLANPIFISWQDCCCQPWKAVILEATWGKCLLGMGLLENQELSDFLLLDSKEQYSWVPCAMLTLKGSSFKLLLVLLLLLILLK